MAERDFGSAIYSDKCSRNGLTLTPSVSATKIQPPSLYPEAMPTLPQAQMFPITLPDVYPAQQIPWDSIPSPAFVLDESRLRRNLSLISQVQQHSGAQIIVAFKGFSMFSTFGLLREYGISGGHRQQPE